MKMRVATHLRSGTLFGLFAGVTLLAGCAPSETEFYSELLDQTIASKQIYIDQKEQRIAHLRQMLQVPGLTAEQEYQINDQLYNEFRKYKLDSAIHYIERNQAIASKLKDRERQVRSDLSLAYLYSSSGLSLEAERLLRAISPGEISTQTRHLYYDTWCHFYQHYAALSGRPKYLQQMGLYRDSLLLITPRTSIPHKINMCARLNALDYPGQEEERLHDLLDEVPLESPYYAEVTCMLGWMYRRQGSEKLAKKYYMLSAITDIKNATKENSSFQALATLYYDRGDLSRAFKYTQAAIEDALSSNVQFRTAQMSELYSIIAASHQTKEAKTKSKLQHYLLLISGLSIVLVLLFIYTYKQMHRLRRTREVLSHTNAELARLNNELNERNGLLSGSNEVKEQYIAQFFDLCSMYIDKMDDYRKSLKKLTENRQYEELYRRLKSTSMLEDELEGLYKNFDAVFLSLYPSFVTDFNALLVEQERIPIRSGDLLNKELRIYALLRLGITDSSRIAAFLRCSLSTLYNYRTKMRNRAAVPREEFEKIVCTLGSTHSIEE